MSRLRSHISDSWKGITPSESGADYNPEPPIFSAKFCSLSNYRNILAIANEDGKIAIQDTDKKRDVNQEIEVSLDGEQCHYDAVFDLEWMPNNMKFLSASADHTSRLWNITESNISLERVFMGHSRSVKTATFRQSDPSVFATGGRDGAILIWDTRARMHTELIYKADNCIYSGHLSGSTATPVCKRRNRSASKLQSNTATSSITGLVFRDDNTLVSCGSSDGILKVWDLRRNYSCFKKEPQPKFSYPYPGKSTFKGYTNLLIDSIGQRLYVSCMDSNIYCFNLGSDSYEPIQQYSGAKITTFYIKSSLSPDGKYILSGSSDEKAYIWNVNNPQPIVALSGHAVEVTCTAWAYTNDTRIVTCSDDARHKIWRIYPDSLDDSELPFFTGSLEKITSTDSHINKTLKNLENTPSSIRRLIEQNECTPNSVNRSHISKKRPFSKINEDEELNFSDTKSKDNDLKIQLNNNSSKKIYPESRWRRLFHDNTTPQDLLGLDDKTLSENVSLKSSPLPNTSYSTIMITPTRTPQTNLCRGHPLVDKTNNSNHFSSPEPTTSISLYNSPTSNLPNYVLNGEAPHLRLTSPKRTVKENDWLTKIRKQKILSSNESKIISMNDSISSSSKNLEIEYSPRIQTLRAESPRLLSYTPKRRNSRTFSNNDTKSPISTENHIKESILHFFPIKSYVSNTNHSPQSTKKEVT